VYSASSDFGDELLSMQSQYDYEFEKRCQILGSELVPALAEVGIHVDIRGPFVIITHLATYKRKYINIYSLYGEMLRAGSAECCAQTLLYQFLFETD
jgi:hypothetical protein